MKHNILPLILGSLFLMFGYKGILGQGKGDTVIMNFDSLDDFTLDLHPWLTFDIDGKLTYGFLNYTFPHMEDPMSFICFNPGSVSPSMANDPAIQPHSGDRFAACFSSNPPGNDDWLISPRIEMGMNPELSFWVKAYTNEYSPEKYTVAVSVTDSLPSSFTVISGTSPLEPTTAWTKKTFNLSAYSTQKVYIAIHCVSSDAFILMVDDIVIKTAGSLNPVADFSADKNQTVAGGKVNFYDLSSGAPTSWQWTFPGGQPEASTLQNPAGIVYQAPGTYDVTLTVTNQFGSSTETKQDFIKVSGYPNEVTLDFESCDDFTLDLSPWTLIDVRGGQTYGIAEVDYPNKYDPKAYMCFNPSSTVPPEPYLKPHAGNKLGCCFSTAYPLSPNDKWLISPRLSLGSDPQLKCWVMTYNDVYGLEKYNVAVSLSDTNPASFTLLTTTPETAPVAWTFRSYDLSGYTGQDVYVGIQCVSDDQFVFMIDDIEITSFVGIKDQERRFPVVSYPNPAAGNLFVKFTGPLPEKCRIELISPLGQRILEQSVAPGKEPVRIDLPSLGNGVYLLSVNSDREILYQKVSIIQ